MAYRYSQLDESLKNRFSKNSQFSTLESISITKGNVRGLGIVEVNFKFPISVICGRNGSGKSTLLALAACAFHNTRREKFNPLQRKVPYYTYSDFFVQTKDEMPPSGIEIKFKINTDQWEKGQGRSGDQVVTKKKGGRWSRYETRIDRCVAFLGIERIVPHSERSVSKSYKGSFRDRGPRNIDNTIREHVQKILGISYEKYWVRSHRKYTLPMVMRKGSKVSGLNMGAGENALFSIFEAIYATEESVLLVIDELELGLHEQAQRRFVEELKELCKSRKIQIIATTHSAAVLEEIPDEGRFMLERIGNTTRVIPEVSPRFAAGHLGSPDAKELEVLVEDNIAATIVKLMLDQKSRTRVRIIPVGSHTAVMRALAMKFLTEKEPNVICILDGDQSSNPNKLKREFKSSLENKKMDRADNWIEGRIQFLPGKEWPEKWIFDQCKDPKAIDKLAGIMSVDKDELSEFIDNAIRAGKHNELHSIRDSIELPMETIISYFVNEAISSCNHVEELKSSIQSFLDTPAFESRLAI